MTTRRNRRSRKMQRSALGCEETAANVGMCSLQRMMWMRSRVNVVHPSCVSHLVLLPMTPLLVIRCTPRVVPPAHGHSVLSSITIIPLWPSLPPRSYVAKLSSIKAIRYKISPISHSWIDSCTEHTLRQRQRERHTGMGTQP